MSRNENNVRIKRFLTLVLLFLINAIVCFTKIGVGKSRLLFQHLGTCSTVKATFMYHTRYKAEKKDIQPLN